jgi:pimeloyl-ACP methyl ester carboxylesterase
MMERSRKLRLGLAVLVAAGIFGYRYYQDNAATNTDADAPAAPATTASAAPAEPVPPRMYGDIAFHPCTLSSPFGTKGIEAQCGSYAVPENPAAPDGRRIELALAWIPADADAEVAPDPVFLLAGGPGQAAKAVYPAAAAAFDDVLDHRNVILLDQRGTGDSNPLSCDLDEDVEPTSEAAVRATRQCRDALSKKADLRFYTTTDAVRDLESVRKALGVEQVNLVGVSYGTRVAQQYAMRHPDHTRTIVLDSVAPNELILGNDFATNLEQALDLQFAQCAKSDACTRQVGDPRAQLDALMATLRTDPPLVRYRDPSTGVVREERLEPEMVAGLFRMYAYMPMAAALLPLQIHEAAQGRYDNLAALAHMLSENIEGQMAMGMQLSVVCAEDAHGLKEDPAAEGTLLGNQLTGFLAKQCEVWPKGDMPADFHQPLSTDVPALVLEGELDPVTPPRYGEQVVRTLPNGRLLVLRGQGHNVFGVGCMPELMGRFIASADAKSLEAKCLDELAYTPPFTTFNGWEP